MADKGVTHSVAVVEDHVLVGQGLVSILAAQPCLEIVYFGSSLVDLLALNEPPELVLLDLDLDGVQVTPANAIDVMARGSQVIAVSALTSPQQVRGLIRVGIAGFASKQDDSDALIEAIFEVLGGQTWTTPTLASILAQDDKPDAPQLSERETEVLTLYASGLKLTAVAHKLEISPHTAREYLYRIRKKYADSGRDARSKTELHREAVRDGLIEG